MLNKRYNKSFKRDTIYFVLISIHFVCFFFNLSSFFFFFFFFLHFFSAKYRKGNASVITKTRLFKYTNNFNHQKMKIFR